MQRDKTRLATVLFAAGILLAGTANAASRFLLGQYNADPAGLTAVPFLSTLLFCANLALYLFGLVFWMRSVGLRLLPSRSRSYLIAAAGCAISMLVLRSVKYRLIDPGGQDLSRYLWYAYYVPMILLPTLFLMTCVNIERRNKDRQWDERMLLVPAAALILLFLTNDLHYLAFRPAGDMVMTDADDSYRNAAVFYLYAAYFAGTVAAGLILLTRATRRLRSFRKTMLPFAFLLVMPVLTVIDKTLIWIRLPSMFSTPEVVSFCMIGLFESCVRNRLIPYNENYAGFFSAMRFPIIITQKDLSVAYRSAEPVSADARALRAALKEPVYPDEDTLLTGKPVTAGYAFYTEDVSELHRMNEKLAEANDLIASENDLIQAENDLSARRAAVDSRNVIYARIAQAMLPYHRKALGMLDEIRPGNADFNESIAKLNLLNAFIKRGTNLMLAGEGEEIPLRELRQAAEESALYLGFFGVRASVASDGDAFIDRDAALRLYTRFQAVIEAISESATRLHIAVSAAGIRLNADCSRTPPETVPAEIRKSDGLYYFIITDTQGEKT